MTFDKLDTKEVILKYKDVTNIYYDQAHELFKLIEQSGIADELQRDEVIDVVVTITTRKKTKIK